MVVNTEILPFTCFSSFFSFRLFYKNTYDLESDRNIVSQLHFKCYVGESLRNSSICLKTKHQC